MKNYVITIGRQCGSGGHSIGKALSERLGIPFYDKEIIELAEEPPDEAVQGINEGPAEGKTHRGADRHAEQQRSDGLMGGVPAAGYGGAAWAVHRAVPRLLLPAG